MDDLIAFEAKLDMLDKKLKDAQKDRQKTEERFKKAEREITELESVKVEDDRHTASLNKMVESLESKLDSYKLKAEEAAQLADHNLNLFRRKQQDLEEMETRLREGNEVLQKLQKK
jgi:peptidoglycan hydrolase CwlO-like protein